MHRASRSPHRHLLKGIGIIPEGINNNPIAYDWMLEPGWSSEHHSVQEWIPRYLAYRYGEAHPTMRQAWEIFLKTVYSSPEQSQEGPSESLFCARPDTDLPSVSTWGTHKRHYDMQLFEQGVKLFLSLEERYTDGETYQTDKTDLIRQVLSNRGKVLYEQMNEAIKTKDPESFRALSSDFLHLLKMQDELLSRSTHFRLDDRLAKYNSFGQTKTDRQQAIRNAKMQYTIWGPDSNPTTNLHEYAHKEWSGLLGTLYYDRWKLFIDYQLKKLQGIRTEAPDYFEIEKRWIDAPTIPSTPRISPDRYREILEQLSIGN